MNILFFGTPDFAESSLEKIYDNREKLDLNILGVVTNPDKPYRKRKKVKGISC